MARWRALSEAELRTVGFFVGCGLLVYWAVTGFAPAAGMVGLVAGLLVIRWPLRRGDDPPSPPRPSGSPGEVRDDSAASGDEP